MSMNIGIYIFDNVEVLDFCGPYEVFTCASRVHGSENPLFNVFTVAESLNPVLARAGLNVKPDYALYDHPKLDCLVIAGGVVSDELLKENVIQWIDEQAKEVKITASVCTGAFLLAKTGLLDGKSATTHWEDISDLRAMFPSISVAERLRWVDEGNIVSSAGISAGIDMSLHLVERLHGRRLAERTARQLEFDWTENYPYPG